MKCKYCGYECQSNNIKFCPNCGKNLVEDAINATHNEVKEEVATTIIDSSLDSDTSELSNKIKRGWNIFRWVISGLLILSAIIAIIEQNTGISIRDKIFGVDKHVEKDLYEIARFRVDKGLSFLNSTGLTYDDIKIGDYSRRCASHKGLTKIDLEEGSVKVDSYIVTVPITIYFRSIGIKTYDLKVWIWDYSSDMNDLENIYGDSISTVDGFIGETVWTICSFGKEGCSEIGTSKVYDSEIGLLLLIYEEFQEFSDERVDIEDFYDFMDYFSTSSSFPDDLMDAINVNAYLLKEELPNIR